MTGGKIAAFLLFGVIINHLLFFYCFASAYIQPDDHVPMVAGTAKNQIGMTDWGLRRFRGHLAGDRRRLWAIRRLCAAGATACSVIFGFSMFLMFFFGFWPVNFVGCHGFLPGRCGGWPDDHFPRRGFGGGGASGAHDSLHPSWRGAGILKPRVSSPKWWP